MEFRKSTGQTLSRQESWIRRNLPLCPFCKVFSHWEIASAATGVKRYYFRCSSCRAIFSALASDVISAPAPIPLPVSPITVLVRVESAGENKTFDHLAGTEHNLGQLQDWARSSS
jgi:hypothetical protein